MSEKADYTFADKNDYEYDDDKIVIDAGEAKLKLLEQNSDYTEDFADDTDFIYEGDKAEFSGGKLQQIDKRPANALFYASFNSDKNGNWGAGNLTTVLGGDATIHDGYLDMSMGNGYLEVPINNFASMQSSTGCIRTRRAFDYTGAAPAVQYLIQTSPNSAARVYLVHNDGFIQCYITNTGGSTIYSITFSWTPNQGQIYEFEDKWSKAGRRLRLSRDCCAVFV
jgi:hypothetical protein